MGLSFYRWAQDAGSDDTDVPAYGYLRIELPRPRVWELMKGQYDQDWDPHATAYLTQAPGLPDFPFTNNDLPVFSPRLKALLEAMGVGDVQYLPLRIKCELDGREIEGYHVANYLRLIDCLDRERSVYQVWTKENLLFWEKRPYMLGTFRDVQKAVLQGAKIAEVPVFRLWGWQMMVVVRGDVKEAMECAGITGCRFERLEVV